jgi:predicted nucleic acid-binding protein
VGGGEGSQLSDTVLVDTSALYAILSAQDPYHALARAAFGDLVRHRDLAVHGYVVSEAVALVAARAGRDAATMLCSDILPTIRFIPVDAELHERAMRGYLDRDPLGASLVDHVSFALMHRDAITTAFAFDSDFRGAGFEVLP